MTNRTCKIVGDDCLIPLTQGKTAAVDAGDYGMVQGRLWNCRKDGNGYYAASKGRRGGKGYTLYLHRFILGEPDSHVDHIDGDGLNCRRSNLRTCTPSQNQANRRRQFGSSMFRGVSLSGSKWMAQIKVLGRAVVLGRFESELDAAMAYDKAASKHFGEFASLNFFPPSHAGVFGRSPRRGCFEVAT